MSFVSAKILTLRLVKDSAGTVTGIRMLVEMHDSVLTETQNFIYVITNSEFAALPASGTARKTAIVAIIKREAKNEYAKWIAAVAARPKPSIVRDPLTDLGVTEITDFVGAAADKT